MIDIDKKIMDVAEFNGMSKYLLKDLEKHLKFDFTIDFRSMMCDEGNSHITIYATGEHQDELIDFVYDCVGRKAEKLVAKYSKEWGDFEFRVGKTKRTNVTNLEIGDLVLIDSSYGNDTNIGIITSIHQKNKKKSFGCSYFIPAFKGEVLPKKHPYSSEIFITEENYGGYHSGFAKKLTSEEADLIFAEQINKKYQKELKELTEDMQSMTKYSTKLFEELKNKKIFSVVESKELKFRENFFSSYCQVPETMKSRFDDEK